MKTYIGTKVIQAERADHMIHDLNGAPVTREGYKVVYPDGYVSWSPRDTFEAAYREITPLELKLIERR